MSIYHLHGKYGLGACWLIFFITTMSASILIPSKLHDRGGDILECGILCCVLVYIGYILSWFTVCNFSNQWDMGDFGWVYYGFWGH